MFNKKIKLIFKKIFHPNKYKNQIEKENNITAFFTKIIEVGNKKFGKGIFVKEIFSIKHSGHSGDIFYALPMMKSLAMLSYNKKINVYLQLNVDSGFSDKEHFSGKNRLNDKVFNSLKLILEKQSYISSVNVYKNEYLDFDFDDFRECAGYLDRGSMSKYYQYVIPLDIDLCNPCLEVIPNYIANNSILINRTFRYRMPCINYKYLQKYESVIFIGLENEYKDLKKEIPKLEWVKTNNFLELAQIISGSKLFIGNQSSSFAIAESLKVNRILETSLTTPNVIPVGGNSIQCCFQKQLEQATEYLYNK